MNTFIDLFFHALFLIAALSTGLFIADLRATTRRWSSQGYDDSTSSGR